MPRRANEAAGRRRPVSPLVWAGCTSHLLSARVQFLTELVIVEVTGPRMLRPRQPQMYDVPLLTFDG